MHLTACELFGGVLMLGICMLYELTGAACIASASAFAPACVGPAARTAVRSGVTDLSMSAGTGKIRKVAAFRAGVPRATNIGPQDYDAAAALGVKQQVVFLYLRGRLRKGLSRVHLIASAEAHRSACSRSLHLQPVPDQV